MINKKIYFRLHDGQYYLSGFLSHEDYRHAPIQGYGVCEIAAWLSDDIQFSINSVNIWINNLIDIKNSRAPDGMFGIGNAHWVLITNGYVFISCEYIEELQVIMSKEQLLYILEQYKAFLEADYQDLNRQPEPIDVEFIAEGKEAINIYRSLDGYHQVGPLGILLS